MLADSCAVNDFRILSVRGNELYLGSLHQVELKNLKNMEVKRQQTQLKTSI
jgi:hypothetical protein